MDTQTLFAIMLTGLLVIAMITDLVHYIIPNWLNGLVLLLYPLMLFLVPEAESVNWLHGLYGFGLVFAVGYVLFLFGIMGGGDVKLLAALALWTGFGVALYEFVLYASLLGGALTLGLLMIRPIAAYVGSQRGVQNLPKVLSHHAPIPYGIALSLGFLIILWNGEIAGLEGAKQLAQQLSHSMAKQWFAAL